MPTLHGLKNCDTCRKALKALDAAGLSYDFVDIKIAPPDEATVARWLEQVPAERLVNRRGTTWRALDETARADADTPDGAARLVAAAPSLAKRPVVEHDDGTITVGFDASVKAKLGLDA